MNSVFCFNCRKQIRVKNNRVNLGRKAIIFVIPLVVLLLLPIKSFGQSVDIRWSDATKQGLNVSLELPLQEYRECLEKGLSVNQRTYFQLCDSNFYWIADCAAEKQEIKDIRFDEVTQTYKITADWLQDDDQPVSVGRASFEDLGRSLQNMGPLSFNYLSDGQGTNDSNKYKIYLSFKTVTTCKGELSQFWNRVSRFLTLGLLDFDIFDSGWQEFKID